MSPEKKTGTLEQSSHLGLREPKTRIEFHIDQRVHTPIVQIATHALVRPYSAVMHATQTVTA
jgi:hypothetical protein